MKFRFEDKIKLDKKKIFDFKVGFCKIILSHYIVKEKFILFTLIIQNFKRSEVRRGSDTEKKI